jgi:hypothetical protein
MLGAEILVITAAQPPFASSGVLMVTVLLA